MPSGSYTLPFYGCIAVELIAAVLIMIRGRGAKTDPHAPRSERLRSDLERMSLDAFETALRASSR